MSIVDYASFYSPAPLLLAYQMYLFLVLVMPYSNLLLMSLKPLQILSRELSHELSNKKQLLYMLYYCSFRRVCIFEVFLLLLTSSYIACLGPNYRYRKHMWQTKDYLLHLPVWSSDQQLEND